MADGPEPAALSITGHRPTIGIRNYLAPSMLWTARREAWLCGQREQQLIAEGDINVHYQHRSHAILCIMSAVAFLEAFVNAIWQDASEAEPGEHSHYTKGIPDAAMATMRELWTGREQAERAMSLLGKFQLALVCAGHPRMDTGAEPYQSVDTLVLLRNALVHFKPEWWLDDADDTRLVSRLRHKITPARENQQPVGEPWFPNKALGAGAANWACDGVIEFSRSWHQRLGLVHDFEGTYLINMPTVEEAD